MRQQERCKHSEHHLVTIHFREEHLMNYKSVLSQSVPCFYTYTEKNVATMLRAGKSEFFTTTAPLSVQSRLTAWRHCKSF